MKLSFSTRGWLDLPWQELVDTALDMRFGGIEVYNLHKTDLQQKGGPFHKYQISATLRDLRDKKLSIPCLDTSIDISVEACETVKSLLSVAKAAQIPSVVVCALHDREERVREALDEILSLSEELGVTLLIKTSGIYADTARLRRLMDEYASDYLGALWDIHHPYRDHGESGDTTIKNLGAYVQHVHLRDSDDADTYNLIGEGSLPVAEMIFSSKATVSTA